MKKIFACLFSSILLVSCGNDNHEDILGGNDDSKETYSVKFTIPAFNIEKTPLAKTRIGEPVFTNYLQYVIYNADNSVAINKIQDENGTSAIQIEEELPVGTYHIAIISARHYQGFDQYKGYVPSNYETDYSHGNGPHADYSNDGVYFENKEFTISKVAANLNTIELLPMWSSYTTKIKDLATCTFPAKTTEVVLKMSPVTIGFNIKDKKGRIATDENGELISLKAGYSVDDIKNNALANFSRTVNPIDSSRLSLEFINTNSTETNLATVIIHDGKFEAGYNITFTGNIGNLANTNSETASFSYSKKALVDKEIEF